MRGILKGGASMLVGYARVSTTEQHLDLQRNALTQAGCGHVFTDTASGANAERPGLTQALSYLQEGDVLAVCKLDRLVRSLKDLLEIVTALEQRGIGFKSLHETALLLESGIDLVTDPLARQGRLGAAQQHLIPEPDAPVDLVVDVIPWEHLVFVEPAADAAPLALVV
jgi:Resolvase, N terminal domain